jgi:tetratricopeptide (TPR) repeat protein
MTGSLRAPQAALFVAAITCVAFLNSFAGTFVFDDIQEIEKNPAMQRLWPPWEAIFVGNKLPARPLPYLTFLLDRAVWGTRPFGYHITNLAIHVVAALAVFALVRLTLLSPRLRSRWAERAVPLAMVIALVWAVHPLQTQSVTYIYQRIESLTGMLCLLSLVAYARAAASGWPPRLMLASVAAAAAAMASKENAVVLPFLVLAYDWFFVETPPGCSWAQSLWRRRWYFAGLAATWGLIGLQLVIQAGKYQEFKEASHTPFEYALTQPGVILYYLRLAVWPVGQQIDYSTWPVAASVRQALPAAAVILAAVAATAVGTLRRQPWAFLGVFFFLVLAPTSSVMPVEAFANEHRMYLALLAVVSAIVLGLVALAERIAVSRPGLLPHDSRVPLALAAAVILLLVLATQFRNQLYSKKAGIWVDVLSKAPDNHRANWMMASILDALGETETALELAERSIRSKPTTQVFSDLAGAHSLKGDNATAERILRRGLDLQRERLGPDNKAVLATIGDLAVALRHEGKLDEAASLCRESLAAMRRAMGENDPATLSARLLIAAAAAARGDLATAEDEATAALETARATGRPTEAVIVNATVILADVLCAAGRHAEAEGVIRQTAADVLRLGSRARLDLAPLDEALAKVFQGAGRLDELVAIRRRIAQDTRLRLGDGHPQTGVANAKLAEAMAAERTQAGDHTAAAALYRQLVPSYAAAMGPEHPETLAMKRRLADAEAAAAGRAKP